MGAPSGDVAVTSGPSRGRNVLMSCLAGCGALALLAISTCAGFVWWVNRPGELLEPARLRGPETTAYLEWTLRLEDPGTAAFAQSLGVDEARLAAQEVKDALKANTEAAAARGVFGVPSYEVDGEVFWGADSIDFVNAYLADPAAVLDEEMRRVDALPVGASRTR